MKVIYNNKKIASNRNSYNELLDKPLINGKEIIGNITLNDIKVYSKDEIDKNLSSTSSIQVVQNLPRSLVENTVYYVGPNKNNKYRTYLVNGVKDKNYLGLAVGNTYTAGAGISIDSENNISINLGNNISVNNSTNKLQSAAGSITQYGVVKPDGEIVVANSEGVLSVPKLSSANSAGNKYTPTYISGGNITASTLTLGVNNSKPIYMSAGELKVFTKTIFDIMYPVGSIYMSVTLDTAAKVQNAFGGTWVAWGSGRVPVCVNTSDTDFNTVEQTGGSKTAYMDVDNLPSHTHTFDQHNNNGTSTNWMPTQYNSKAYKSYIGTSWTGGSSLTYHNNIQPYIVCYMYKRTA